MKKFFTFLLVLNIFGNVSAERVLSLDSCRNLALSNNKQLSISRMKKDMAKDVRKAAFTKYLPKVDIAGSYEYTSRPISLLNDEQKAALTGIGTEFGTAAATALGDQTKIVQLVQAGVLNQQQAVMFSQLAEKYTPLIAQKLNQVGESIKDAFDTNTQHIFTGTVEFRQPIFMGGAIIAANKMAKINEDMASNGIELQTQTTLYEIDHAYWLVVSLRQKQKLADSFYSLVEKLNGDVEKMIREGVATKADGLKVAVKLNEAEMAKSKVDDGYTLAKMLLCQLCGIDMESDIRLADEDRDLEPTPIVERQSLNPELRPEFRILENMVDLSRQGTRLVTAQYLPQIAVLGGYTATNPNLFNGFQRKFGGFFHVGVGIRMNVWNWMESKFKRRASKTATKIAETELEDVREKMQLQVKQNSFKVQDASRKLAIAMKTEQSAEENLRCANLGFREGVMQSTDVLLAQTAWLKAKTQKIDAEIDVKLSQLNLDKSLGTLK